MERSREAYWLRYPGTTPFKLRWRALTARHCLHVLPGESILEIGAGSGLWTEHLAEIFGAENPITAAVFNDDFASEIAARQLPGTEVVRVDDFDSDLKEEGYDYIIGTAILCHDRYSENLRALHRRLKPGGQILFFEANYWNPQVFLKNTIGFLGRWTGQASCQIGMRKFQLMHAASHEGFIQNEAIPYDIIHSRTPRALVPYLQSVAFVCESSPLIRQLCGTLYIWCRKPGGDPVSVNLAQRRELFGAVSVVVPCHNEEMNAGALVKALLATYDAYIHEIILVNDNSTDGTAKIIDELAARDRRVIPIHREKPNGVGLALRDGYAAARGRYILSLDCDFVQIVPELRALFEAVANGRDGAIGSRFSRDSILINYPFFKIVCNRLFHIVVNLFLRLQVRDVSNNLKLYRSDIFQELDLEAPHFAANAETGLKPLLKGYDIAEVPASWINRTTNMGSSTFTTARVGASYFKVLANLVWRNRGARIERSPQPGVMLNGENVPDPESNELLCSPMPSFDAKTRTYSARD